MIVISVTSVQVVYDCRQPCLLTTRFWQPVNHLHRGMHIYREVNAEHFSSSCCMNKPSACSQHRIMFQAPTKMSWLTWATTLLNRHVGISYTSDSPFLPLFSCFCFVQHKQRHREDQSVEYWKNQVMEVETGRAILCPCCGITGCWRE